MDGNTLFSRAQRYVGMPYEAGQFDCADLAVQVQRELFGRVVALPAHQPAREEQQLRRPAGARGQGAMILSLRETLAQRVEAAADGCGALLWEPEGDPGQDLRRWHIGTVFLHAGEIWVLHNSALLGGAALHRLDDLRRMGMRLEGFYVWRAGA